MLHRVKECVHIRQGKNSTALKKSVCTGFVWKTSLNLCLVSKLKTKPKRKTTSSIVHVKQLLTYTPIQTYRPTLHTLFGYQVFLCTYPRHRYYKWPNEAHTWIAISLWTNAYWINTYLRQRNLQITPFIIYKIPVSKYARRDINTNIPYTIQQLCIDES